jgi:hypothetical protein
MEGLTNEEGYSIFEIKLELFSISIITISDEIISLLNVRIIDIKINDESKP